MKKQKNADPIDLFLSLQNTESNQARPVSNAWFRPPNARKLLGTGALLSSLLTAAATPNNAVMARSPRHSVEPVPVSAPYQSGSVDPFAFRGVPDGTLRQKGGMAKPKKPKRQRTPISPQQHLGKLERENVALREVNQKLGQELYLWRQDTNASDIERSYGVGPLPARQTAPTGNIEEQIKALNDENYRLQKNNNVMRDEIYRLKALHQKRGYDAKYGKLDDANIAPRLHRQNAGRLSARAKNL